MRPAPSTSASAAPRAVLGQLSAGDVVAVLDLSTARPGRRLFHLTPDQVRVPFGVEVTLRRAWHAAARVRTLGRESGAGRAVGRGPAGGRVRVERVTVEPAEVEVVGPESVLRELKQAATEPVALDGATASSARR